ncbi:MAG: Uma2 family endonuclease [Moraxellaceae bacterium]|jgi:Uma2 family endonuclease|nr:Uma2 family endonuclease [Moraxellaceae bacterium]MBK9186092.1 Uma2 family endonuclease [Moraxellaceae bacterium]MBL0231556.1 Uma2 family endonuclease [Moraxellaceae bacterium]
MSIATKYNVIAEKDYLAGELQSEVRHEYIDGQVYAMSGAHKDHNRIAGEVFRILANHLQDNPCQPYASDMKVKVDKSFFYPDVMVDCSGKEEDYYTEFPTIIVEVLSKSTRQHDKTFKRQAYFQIPSLQEYILIEQDFVEIERWYKTQDNHWEQSVHYLGDDITFASLNLTVTVEDIYRRVKNADMLEWLARKEQQVL